ncbi:uncharacterized protein YecT (DUF1311 family) [Paraburkholderia sp. GAS42]|jgi:uncharacterized protein YecT (DUF1311 family)
MHRHCLAAIVLLFTSASAVAADIDCKNPMNQASMNMCASRDFKASDKKLNETYRALSTKSSRAGRDKLQKAQRAWLAWRDAQCEFNTLGSVDGSVHPMVHAACLDQLTQAQTKLLSEQLHCQEGDMSCGNQ